MISLKMKMRTKTIFQVYSEFENEKTYYIVDLINWKSKVSDDEVIDEKLTEDMRPMKDDVIMFVIKSYFNQFKEHQTVSKEIKEAVELKEKTLFQEVIL